MPQKKRKGRKTKPAKATPKPTPAAPRSPWWEGLSGPVQHNICVAFLLGVALVFFAPALFSGKTLVGGDTVGWRAVAETMLEYRETTGEEPLWATNLFGGMPGYVVSLPKKVPQIDLLADTLRAFAWPVSHFIFLLLGAYLLVFFLTSDKLSGVLAACAYGLTTYLPIILVAGHNTKFVALCYAPWVVLAFVYALRKPGLVAGLLFAIALAVNLRANHIQITYYLAFLLGIWWMVEGTGAIRKGEGKAFAVSTGWLALGTLLAVLMVAQPYLSTYEYNRYSIRGASAGGGEGGLDWNYAMSWSQGLGELLTLLIAEAYGGAALYWGPKPPTGGPHYVGGIVLFLAVVAIGWYRRRTVWALGAASLVMTLFALGRHFESLNRLMYEYFPLFKLFRVPETWLIAVALALAMLAGLGLCYIVRREPSREAEQQKTKTLYLTAGALVGLVLVLYLGKSLFFDFERPGEFEQAQQYVASQVQRPADDPQVIQTTERLLQEQLVVPRAAAFEGDALRTLLFLLLAVGVLVAYRKGKIPGWALQGALVLLVALDLGGVGRRYFNEDRLRPAPNAEAILRAQTTDADRFLIQKRDEAGGLGHFRVLSLEQPDQTKNARPSYYFESLGGYSGAKLRLYQDYLEQLLFDPQTGLPNENAIDLLNVRYVVSPQPLPDTREVHRGQQFLVLENPDAVPRAFLVGETEVVPSPEDTWARLRNPAFDPHRTVLLPEAPAVEPTPIDSTSTATVVMQRYGPREMAWTVETDAPRLLVVSEVYYPAGWNAYLDGEPVSIQRANYLLRAVPVPAGTHDVVMRFEPTSYRLSLWLSGLATLFAYGGVFLLLGLAWQRRRTTPEEAPTTTQAS